MYIHVWCLCKSIRVAHFSCVCSSGDSEIYVLSVEVYAHTFSLLIVVMALECACVCGSYAAPGTRSVTLSLFAVTMLLSVMVLLAREQEP